MKAMVGFLFFMLFLGGLAFVNLRNTQDLDVERVTSAASLTDVAWRLSHIDEMVMDAGTDVYIQFQADGAFTGYGGCNRIFGTASFAGALDLGDVGMTRRTCPSPANGYEYAFLEALGNTTGAVRLDQRLAFRNADDRSVLRFVAVPRKDE